MPCVYKYSLKFWYHPLHTSICKNDIKISILHKFYVSILISEKHITICLKLFFHHKPACDLNPFCTLLQQFFSNRICNYLLVYNENFFTGIIYIWN